MKHLRHSASSIEMLEPRIAPAVIDIVTAGGNATLKVLGNTDTIENLNIAGTTNGTIFITGMNGETFRVNGVPGNGPIQLDDIVGSLSVDLGKNNDTLVVTGVFIGGALALKMGDGTNTTTITSTTAGSLSFNGGKGNDFVTINGSVLDLAGKATFTPGSGTNSVLVAANSVRIGGDLSYSGGSFADTLVFTNNDPGDITLINGSVVFKGAAGSNTLSLNSPTLVIGKNLSYLSGPNLSGNGSSMVVNGDDLVRIGGSVSYVNPTGPQSLGIFCDTVVEISGAVTINANPTTDTEAIFGAGDFFSSGKFSVLSKGNHLTIKLNPTVMAIGGPLTATGVKGFATGAAGTISGPVTISAGAGGIILADANDNGALNISGKTTLKITGNANTSTTLLNVRFLSSFTATLGAGVDNFFADNITTFGAFTLNSGLGGDAISIEANAATGVSTFYGPVLINLGPGSDILQVGDNDPAKKAVALRTFKVTAGLGETISLLNNNTFLVAPTVT